MKHQQLSISFSFILMLTLAIVYASKAQKLPLYNIYAGNTHAHTAYTWLHGRLV